MAFVKFSSGMVATLACMPGLRQFSGVRVCWTLLRYRSHSIFFHAGTRELLALPLPLDFLPCGYARASCVTALTRFSSKRVRESLLRYRSHSIFFHAGTRGTLALPLSLNFLPSGYARASCVTALTRFFS